ncbi:portal protein [Aminobacter sp. HY435]|uniref:portal protein n=1 Tax=Aminobacter sp. HY435 TaxID=2970917 RepID=UPI0022B97D28|nr:portal protein [Aminobacter sp. HY435]
MADDTDGITKYSLGTDVKAEDVYNRLTTKRQAVVDMGRLMAELTVPSVFPPDGYQTGDDIPGNNQSIGAQCLNTLASALMFMAFPSNQPIMRLKALEYMVQEEVDKDPELWTRLNTALSRLELSHRERLQTTPIETAYVEYLKILLVGGNGLWKHLKLSSPTAHRPPSYVVKRDKAGEQLLVIHKETVNLQGMDQDHVDLIMAHAPSDLFKDKAEWEREVDIYSVQKLSLAEDGEKVWLYWEEWEGHVLPDTHVETDYETPPMHAGWLIPVWGQDWGQGYCEQYRGDLYQVEALASAGNDGAALAALALIFNKPGSQTSIKQVREAKNLSILSGQAEDLSVFRSDKTADLSFVGTREEAAARRLSAAFLLQSSVQRSGERVTAEEVRRLGQELDKALGGLYTQIAQGNQRVIIMRAVRLNEEENPRLPQLPKGVVEVQVITGKDALGDSTEADNLVEVVGTTVKFFPQAAQVQLSAGDFARRLSALRGVKPDGLIKSDQQVAEDIQQQKQEALGGQLIDKATGPAVKGFADAMAQQPAQTLQ